MRDNRFGSDEPTDEYNDPFAHETPSWTNESPPATLPTLPPIRSATTPLGEAIPPSEGALLAQRDVRRDMMATLSGSPQLAKAPKSGRKATSAAPPMIITGDGRVSHLRPTIGSDQPRSRKMRVALVALAGSVVLLFLLAATPLTAGASSRIGNFIAGANAWNYPTATALPTATPVPDPYSGSGPGGNVNPGTQAVINDIKAVFGGYSAGALGVSYCESRFDPNAWNRISILGSHAEGVFQILYPSTWLGTSYASQSPYNYDANIHAAYQIFARDGFTWREWECQP